MKWRELSLGELAVEGGGLIQTGPFGSQLHQSEYQPDGIPVIMPKDIIHGRVAVDGVAKVSEETAERLGRHKLKERAIVCHVEEKSANEHSLGWSRRDGSVAQDV